MASSQQEFVCFRRSEVVYVCFSLLISITGIRWRGTLFSITEGSVFAGGKEPSGWL